LTVHTELAAKQYTMAKHSLITLTNMANNFITTGIIIIINNKQEHD